MGTLGGLCAANDLVPLLYKDVDHRDGRRVARRRHNDLPYFLRAILRQVRAGVPKEGKSGILFIPFNPSLLVFIDPS